MSFKSNIPNTIKALTSNEVARLIVPKAQRLAQIIRSRTPVGTGSLQRSIQLRIQKFNVYVGSPQDNAFYQEFGTRDEAGNQLVTGKGMFRKSFDENAQQIAGQLEKDFKKLIDAKAAL